LSDFEVKLCSECGHPAEHLHGDYEFELAFPIKLEDVELLKCLKCGHVEPAVSFEALKEGGYFRPDYEADKACGHRGAGTADVYAPG
jgi:Zn ribbon nucleic-acid-binding protein